MWRLLLTMALIRRQLSSTRMSVHRLIAPGSRPSCWNLKLEGGSARNVLFTSCLRASSRMTSSAMLPRTACPLQAQQVRCVPPLCPLFDRRVGPAKCRNCWTTRIPVLSVCGCHRDNELLHFSPTPSSWTDRCARPAVSRPADPKQLWSTPSLLTHPADAHHEQAMRRV